MFKLAVFLIFYCICTMRAFDMDLDFRSQTTSTIEQYKKMTQTNVLNAYVEINAVKKDLEEYSLNLLAETGLKISEIATNGIKLVQKSSQEASQLGFNVQKCTNEPLGSLKSITEHNMMESTDCFLKKVKEGKSQFNVANEELQDILSSGDELDQKFEDCLSSPSQELCFGGLALNTNQLFMMTMRQIQELQNNLNDLSDQWTIDIEQCANSQVLKAKLAVAQDLKRSLECIIFVIQDDRE